MWSMFHSCLFVASAAVSHSTSPPSPHPPPPRVCAVLEETDVSGGVRCSYNFGLLIQRYSRLVMQHDPRTALNYLYFARYVSVCVCLFVCVCLCLSVPMCISRCFSPPPPPPPPPAADLAPCTETLPSLLLPTPPLCLLPTLLTSSSRTTTFVRALRVCGVWCVWCVCGVCARAIAFGTKKSVMMAHHGHCL